MIKNMKTALFFFLVALGLSGGTAFAQDSLRVAAPQQIAQTILEKLDHEVALSKTQKAEVHTLLLERSEKFSQVKKNGGAKKLARADFRQANQQALGKLQAVLTPEQFTKLKTLRQEDQRQKAAYKEEDVYRTIQDIELDF
jgi:hypothetical protein